MKISRVVTVCAAVFSFAALATPATAGTGCNGVINPLVWGCAPWDNNNGPKFPYFKKVQINIPQKQAQIFTKDGVQLVRDLRNGQVSPVITVSGGNVIAAGGGNAVAAGGLN